MGLVIGISDSAAFTSPPVLIRRRAIAIATFSLPWKYLLATSEDICIFTLGSQSTSSVHSQWRLPSSPRPARMLTTRSTSSNSNRWGTSASRSFGPIPGSSLIIVKIRSMTSTNSFGDRNDVSMVLPSLPGPRLRLAGPDVLWHDGAAVTIHLRPTAGLAERALLTEHPGLAMAMAVALVDKPLMVNHSHRLWG